MRVPCSGSNLARICSPKIRAASRAFRPLDIERQAFFVSGEDIAIDLEHPRISEGEGEPLFDEAGEPADALRRIQRALGLLVTGNEETGVASKHWCTNAWSSRSTFLSSFDDGDKLRFNGLYTVSMDAIHDLDDAAALSLFRKGYLRLAYTMAGSLKQIRRVGPPPQRSLGARRLSKHYAVVQEIDRLIRSRP